MRLVIVKFQAVHAMIREQRAQQRKSDAAWERAGTAAALILALALAVVFDNRGMPQKWHTAIFGTVVPFMTVIMILRWRWPDWSTWVSVAICLAFHSVAIWAFFRYVILGAYGPGMLLWYPVALVEVFVLIAVVKPVAELLTGRKEIWYLSSHFGRGRSFPSERTKPPQ